MGRIMRSLSLSIVTWVKNSSFESMVLPIIFLPNFFIDALVILVGSFLLSGNIPKNSYPFRDSRK
jgi:membrane-bound acyltransferase YfiQ involved in biofilm formation